MTRVLSFLGIAALLWAVGFAVFLSRLPQPAAEPPALAEGVAVYTGGGGARIAAAMSIFSQGAGERLLISGVHPDTTRSQLSQLWSGDTERFDCCVDLGHEALTTKGNADELTDWAQGHAYKKIILVTSDYHMPRAMVATKATLKGAELTPYTVSSGYLDEHGRPASLKATMKLAWEYTKFLLAYANALVA